MSNRAERSHTKAGPGRYHGQGALIVHDGKRYVRPSHRRFPVAAHGGSWQGKTYLAYREHDRIFQLMSRPPFMTRPDAVAAMLAERKAGEV